MTDDKRTPKPFSQEDFDTIHEMRRNGSTFREIGELLGRTRSSIAGFCMRHKVKGPTSSQPAPKQPIKAKAQVTPVRLPKVVSTRARLILADAIFAQPDTDDGVIHTGVDAVVHIRNSQCRWPVGDPRADDFRFCCKPKDGARVYCREHAGLAYYAPGERRP